MSLKIQVKLKLLQSSAITVCIQSKEHREKEKVFQNKLENFITECQIWKLDFYYMKAK